MDTSTFTSKSSGTIVRTLDGHPAFLPRPLPPKIDVTWPLAKTIADADRALGKLCGIGRLLPDPHILVRPLLRREAVLSSRIEGTEASLSDLVMYEVTGVEEDDLSDVRGVSNYVHALEHGLRRLEELPLSLRFIREVHEVLMTGVRGANRAPGTFRTAQNWIGPPGASLAAATYVPPPVPQMTDALHALERYLHAHSDLPLLVRAALIHYQFEAIHPFLDGNGRVGRLLLVFLLHVEKVLDEPLLYLSAYFEEHRSEYYRLLLEVSRRGAWLEWIDFFMEGVLTQCNDVIVRVGRMLDLADQYRDRMTGARNAVRLGRMIDHLLARPATTITEIAKKFRISYPAAKKNVQKLVAAKILEPVSVGRGNVYLAREIISVIDD